MPSATVRRHRAGFLYYYDDPVPGRPRRRSVTYAVRAATICAVLALIHLIGLTLGPTVHS